MDKVGGPDVERSPQVTSQGRIGRFLGKRNGWKGMHRIDSGIPAV